MRSAGCDGRTLDLHHAVLTIRRTVFIGHDAQLQEKDTKTHQQRRVVLDPETAAILAEHHARVSERAAALVDTRTRTRSCSQRRRTASFR